MTEGVSSILEGVEWIPSREPVLDAVTVPAAGKGSFQAVVLDMGETVVGPASLSVFGGKANVVVDLCFFEVMGDAGRPTIPFPAFCHASMANRLTLRSGETSCDFFHLLGFRFVLVVVHESPGPISFHLTVQDTGYPYRPVGKFICSDPLLNKIWKACKRTEEVCSLDSYVDTPWREQAQWWGDAHIQFRNSLTMDWDPRLMRRGLLSILGQRLPNGLTYGNAPSMAHNCVLPDYSLFWLISLHDYYVRTLDFSVFEENQQAVEGILGYFENEAPRSRGLLAWDPRYWLFLDWSSLEKKGTPTLFSMWYVHALRCVSRLYQIARQDSRALEWDRRAQSVLDALLLHTFDAQEGLFHDGFAEDGKPLGVHSVHVQTLAILLDLKPENHKTMVEKRILPYLAGENLGVPTPSAYWATFVISAARRQGLEEKAIEFIRKRWESMAAHGTTFEVFGPTAQLGSEEEAGAMKANWGHFSASHAWSAHPMFHLTEILGGVTEIPETTERIHYRPSFPQGLSFATLTVPHPAGPIETSWKREEGGIQVDLALPPGVEAEVRLPGFSGRVTGSFHHLVPRP